MGDNTGKLKIRESFSLPDGIVIIDPVTEFPINGTLPRYGCGSVHLKISLLNFSDSSKTAFFPKGLIWKCDSPDNHNLILLQTTWISLDHNEIRTFILDAYCINLARKHPADNGITFEILGLTDSKVMNNLLNLIGWRKINYEMLIGSGSDLKTDAYLDVMQPLRDLVWRLTDSGIDITDEDINSIDNIPELSESEIPPIDQTGKFPEYFDEYRITAFK
jgi:hypothetical protein